MARNLREPISKDVPLEKNDLNFIHKKYGHQISEAERPKIKK